MNTLTPIASFRAAAYAAFSRRQDALFELCDTLLTTGPIPSLPFLSVQPQHRRGWGSLYDALAAVTFARDHGLVVSIPGGGHNIGGKTGCDGGVMIDLSPLKSVRGDPPRRPARAQPGGVS